MNSFFCKSLDLVPNWNLINHDIASFNVSLSLVSNLPNLIEFKFDVNSDEVDDVDNYSDEEEEFKSEDETSEDDDNISLHSDSDKSSELKFAGRVLSTRGSHSFKSIPLRIPRSLPEM